MAKPRTRPRGSTARPKPTDPHHSKPSDLGRRIVRDPKVLGGKPTVRGTRVAVDFFPHVNSEVYLDRLGFTPLLTFSAAPHD